MDIVIKIAQFILSFSLLVLIHECGHFLFARLFGIRVEKFYLFFNPWFSLFKFKRGETEYGIGWVPFGGYVKIAGMIDESMDGEQMKEPIKSDEFRAKPAWQRLLVMVGGVMMNVILALGIYIGISYTWGDEYFSNDQAKYGYVFSDLGKEIGFENGDKILSINGQKVDDFSKILLEIVLNQGSEVQVLRGDQTLMINIDKSYTPQLLNLKSGIMEPRIPFHISAVDKDGTAIKAGVRAGDIPIALNGEPMAYIDQYTSAFAANKGQIIDLTMSRDSAGIQTITTLPIEVSNEGKVGVHLVPATKFFEMSTKQYTFLEAIPAGFSRTGSQLSSYGKQVKLIFSPETEAYKSLGGVIAIGNIFPGYWSWESFWSITAFLSIILAVMNILPIPALDGGHVLFLLYEVVTRRKPSDKFMENAQVAGMMIIFALLIFANGNDIYRFFIK